MPDDDNIPLHDDTRYLFGQIAAQLRSLEEIARATRLDVRELVLRQTATEQVTTRLNGRVKSLEAWRQQQGRTANQRTLFAQSRLIGAIGILGALGATLLGKLMEAVLLHGGR